MKETLLKIAKAVFWCFFCLLLYVLLQTVIEFIITIGVLIPALKSGYAAAGIQVSRSELSLEAVKLLSGEYSHLFMIIFNAAVIVIVLYALKKRELIGLSGEKIYSARPISVWSAIIGGIFTSALISVILTLVLNTPSLGGAAESYSAAIERASRGPIAAELISTILFAPISEELLLRGMIFGRLRRDFPAAAAIIVSSAIFAVLHGNPVWICYALVLGIILGIIRETTGSLICPIVFHIAFNAMGYLVTFISLDSPLKTAVIILVGIVESAISIIIMKRATLKENEHF